MDQAVNLTIRGQWLGTLLGDPGGLVVLDLDERPDRYTGTALFMSPDASIPHTAAIIDTGVKGTKVKFSAAIFPVHQFERRALTPKELEEGYPGVYHDGEAEIVIEADGDALRVSYKTLVTSAAGELKRYGQTSQSQYVAANPCTWSEFKAQVDRMNVDDYVWRGQPYPWALKTAFHRTGRVDLRRYVQEDVPRLSQELIPFTTAFLEIQSPVRMGGLYNLAQHHGFPTPVLDWTFSPYVAAFFALRSRPAHVENEECPARIFAFDQTNWPKTAGDITHLMYAPPHVTLMTLPPLENRRASPQQAVAMVTNIDGIEPFIGYEEQRAGREFLLSFDLPWSERARAMRDLRTMGITAASMFPGLDGVCEELRHRLFEES